MRLPIRWRSATGCEEDWHRPRPTGVDDRRLHRPRGPPGKEAVSPIELESDSSEKKGLRSN